MPTEEFLPKNHVRASRSAVGFALKYRDLVLGRCVAKAIRGTWKTKCRGIIKYCGSMFLRLFK